MRAGSGAVRTAIAVLWITPRITAADNAHGVRNRTFKSAIQGVHRAPRSSMKRALNGENAMLASIGIDLPSTVVAGDKGADSTTATRLRSYDRSFGQGPDWVGGPHAGRRRVNAAGITG